MFALKFPKLMMHMDPFAKNFQDMQKNRISELQYSAAPNEIGKIGIISSRKNSYLLP
jgi:hypothetical protein